MKNNYPASLPLEDLVIQSAGELAESLSINRVAGQLYALLYVSPQAVSLDGMAERLKISKGSASVNIRILEEWNAVKTVWVKGSRKDFYTADPDFLKIITQRLEQGLSRRLRFAEERIRQAKELLNGKPGGGADRERRAFYLSRLGKLEEARELLATVLQFLPQVKNLKKLGGLGSLFLK